MVRHQIGPDAKRKMIVRDLPDTECARTREPRRPLPQEEAWRRAKWHRPPARFENVRHAGRALRNWSESELVDKCARAGPAFDVSFGEQLRIGAEHGNARNSQFVGQRPRRGNLLIRLQPAFEDHGAERIVDLAMERLFAFPIHSDHRRGGAMRLLTHFGADALSLNDSGHIHPASTGG